MNEEDEQAGSKSEEAADDVAKRERLEILALFGAIDFDPAYDYKGDRKRKR